MAAAIREALATESGSVLAFLPGQREIERTAERLAGRVADDRRRRAALRHARRPRAGRRHPPGARRAAQGGARHRHCRDVAHHRRRAGGDRFGPVARVPRYEPASGLTRLETVRVSRAAADQRAGRAGRTGPGVAIRLWRAEQTGALQPYSTPEILEADLASLVLDCAAFGVADPAKLAFLDPPPAPALAEARALLGTLGALDADGRVTAQGATMRRLGLPVRLAHMLAAAPNASAAARLAVLMTERGLGGDSVDLDRRLSRLATDRSPRATAAKQMAERLTRSLPSSPDDPTQASVGALLLHAWPDRVAKARGERGRFVLANGSGAMLDAADPLAGEGFLVVADMQGKAQSARITAAAAVSEAEIRATLPHRLQRRTVAAFDVDRRSLRLRETVTLGAIVLSERMLAPPRGLEADQAVLGAVAQHGLALLPFSDDTRALRARLAWLHRMVGEPWPDMSDAALLARLDEWLAPWLTGEPALSDIDPSSLRAGLVSLVPPSLRSRIDGAAPTHFEAPTGNRLPIRYDGDTPVLAIRVQELFGLARHPAIGDGAVPLTLELLSPAHRPIQTTRDLPGFWRGSWAEVRAEMRGRYPRHVWPEDPANAAPTSRAKPRGT